MSNRGTSLDFVFSNLLSGTYSGSTIEFLPSGDKLLLPQGNRLVIFDCARGESKTHYIEHPATITHVAVSDKDDYIATSDAKNNLFISQLGSNTLCYRKMFKEEITAIAFGPGKTGLIVGSQNKVRFFKHPSEVNSLKPFIKKRPPIGDHHFAAINTIAFSPDGKLVATCSSDLSVHIMMTEPNENFAPISLTGHRGKPLFAFFDKENPNQITTCGGDGTLFVWELDDEFNIKIISRRRLDEDDFDKPKTKYQTLLVGAYNGDVIITGDGNGTFKTYAVPGLTMPVMSNFTVRFSTEKVQALAISKRFAAFTSAKLGELIVWDLQTGSVAQRSQGHYGGVSCFAYSPNGIVLATGGDDGKLKLWDSYSGSCLMTFDEHRAPITDVVFGESGRTVVTSSLDGTCKAFDVVRGKCFREMTTEVPHEFTHVAVNPKCEIVAASTKTDTAIILWDISTGKVLEELTGHTQPISSLSFTPLSHLVSGSWDGTVRIWDFLETQTSQPYDAHGEVTASAVSPDGKILAIANSNGRIIFYATADESYLGDMNIVDDARGGKLIDGQRSAKNTRWFFDSLDFSPDGSFIVCGGRTKFICVYSVANKVLMRRFAHTRNTEFSGVEGYIQKFHGSGKADDIVRAQFAEKLVITAASNGVKFCPTGRGLAAATPEGLLVYISADQVITDPIELEVDVTPESIKKAIQNGEYVLAVTLGVRLGHTERAILRDALMSVPDDQIDFVANHLPQKYVADFLQFLSEQLRETPEVELIILWMKSCLRYHSKRLKQESAASASAHLIQKAFAGRIDPVKVVARNNLDTLTFLCSQPDPQ